MRRLVALLVLALLGATLCGLTNNASGISVNGSTVSNSTFRGELAAITSNTTLSCYIAKLDPTTIAAGVGGASVGAAGAAAWANLRVEGLAIDQYAKRSLKFHASAQTLAKAETSLEGELNAASASASTHCQGSAAEALAEMPSEMRNFEVLAQASSLDLVAKLNTTVPLTLPSMREYYSTHTTDYDTICVSVAVVTPADVTAFDAARTDGLSVAALAKKFSIDPSSKQGGALGCYGPTNADYASVRADTAATPVDTFPKTPFEITYNNSEEALYMSPTKRTPTPFAKAEASVLSDLESANATAANSAKESILDEYYLAIGVDPAFGSWGLSSSGPTVYAPVTPPSRVVGSTTIAALTAGASSYK